MCGIAGQFNYLRQDPVDPETIHRMARAITRRGPDDEGYFIAGPLGLGFRRLSIIDLSGGHQPMSDAGQKVWVIFNGEIYNFRELRSDLEGRGYRFRTNSDTEVIVHGFLEWGTDLFNRLNGMFGLAVWDVRQRRLVVARDAMGIKMVYYRNSAGQLTFGSEIRAIHAAHRAQPEVDPLALSQFLRFRYTPSPLTLIKGIQKLAPGTMLVAEEGNFREERWYHYSPVPFDKPKSADDATEELLELYRAAVKRHLMSDVPVGILLSGGLDSGLLLALMKEHGQDWPAYTVGYGDSFKDDELRDAAETAALFGSRHVPVRLDREEYELSFPKIVESLEEPVASSSVVPMYFVCRRARENVKVALIGQGPDEMLGGYKRHLGVHYGALWRGMPQAVRSLITSAVDRLPRSETLKRGVHSLGTTDRLTRYEDIFSLAPANAIHGLFQSGILPEADRSPASWRVLLAQMEHLDELGGFQLMEIRSSLPDELLMFGDKLSMAHGLEARVPYLDRTVVEYVQRLDASMKVRWGKGKWLHRQVCRRLLPPQLLQRKKRGFAVNVVDEWFNDSLRGKFPDMLVDKESRIFRLLRPEPVQKLLQDHQSKKQDNHKLLFSLVIVEQWLRGF